MAREVRRGTDNLDDASVVCAFGQIDFTVRMTQLRHGTTSIVSTQSPLLIVAVDLRRGDEHRYGTGFAQYLGTTLYIRHFAQYARTEIELLVYVGIGFFGYVVRVSKTRADFRKGGSIDPLISSSAAEA